MPREVSFSGYSACHPSDPPESLSREGCERVGQDLIPLLTADEMGAWDAASRSMHGVAEFALMESAGRVVADVVDLLYPRGRIVGVVGRGKNGGDTLIALRTLLARGREVAAVVAPADRPADQLAHGWAIPFVSPEQAAGEFAGATALLDGILGTGAQGAPRQPQAEMISRMNAAERPIVAVDGPSGVDLTTGQSKGAAVRADITVTFGALKRGLLLYPGRRLAGRILVAEIGFPPLDGAAVGAGVATRSWARARLPKVRANAHKGTLGNVVVVAGEQGVAGAAALVGLAAARAGAGKVYLISAAENREILQTILPEALFRDRASDGCEEALAAADAVVAGPGMGTTDEARDLLRRLFASVETPLLLDADALTMMASDAMLRPRPGTPVILTPHPGELSRMIGLPVKQIVENPFTALEVGLQRFGGSILLKGAPSLIGERGRPAIASIAGHSGIATGGMGDTLAGIAGAFMAVGAPPYEAGTLALHYSGRAAELAGRGRGLLPRDVVEWLPQALLEPPPSRPVLPGILMELPVPY